MNETNGQHGMLPVDIIKVMIPYTDSSTAASLDLMLKAGDLIDSLQRSRSRGDLSINELSNNQTDIEGMIMAIQAICSPKERIMLDKMLMLMRIRKIMAVSHDQNMMMEVLSSLMPADQKGMMDEILPILAMMS